MAQGLAAIAEKKRKEREAQEAASAPKAPAKPAPKKVSPPIEGLRKPAPYVPIKGQTDAEKEESRRMMEAELRVRQRNQGK